MSEEMTDKQMHSKNLSVELDKSRSTATSLIIDGVDVSGCSDISGHVNDFGEYECLCRCIFGDGSDDYGVIGHEMCKNNPNCHYKQLERLKEHHHKTECEASENLKKLVELEQECEQQKAELELFKTSNQTTIDQLKKENEELKKLYKELQDDMLICRKCKATFYLKKYANKDSECLELQHKVNILKQTLTEIKEYCIQQNLKADYTACEILQKINKVIDEN